MYKYDTYDQAMVDARVEEFRDQARRRLHPAPAALVRVGVRVGVGVRVSSTAGTRGAARKDWRGSEGGVVRR